MRSLIIAACFAGLAAPAAAQDLAPPPRDYGRNLPRGDDIEALAPALDRSVDAMLELDVGPLIDAADPFARNPGYGRPGRTLREMGRRNDPAFDRRMRDSIYFGTARAARMMDAFAAAMPAMQRSLEQAQRSIERAIRSVPPRGLPPGDFDDSWDRDYDDEAPGEEPYDD